jgi:putative endonuclease
LPMAGSRFFYFGSYSTVMYYVYALYAPDYEKIYVGYTSNLRQRLLSHNELGTKGWTVNYRPWELV